MMDTAQNDRSRELIRLVQTPGHWAHYWRKNPPLSAWFASGKPARVPQAWLDADLYFSVNAVDAGNPRGPGHRVQNAHVRQVRVVYADLDSAGASMPLQPSITVNSGRGTHAYWLLSEPIAASAATELQRRWVHTVGADPAAVDLARVLRVPGSVNTKNGQRVTVETWEPNRRYAAAQLWEAIGCIPSPVREVGNDRTITTPSQGGDATGIVSKILRSRQGEEFARLMSGSHNYRSHSEADAALTRMISWWCKGDTAAMLAIWQSSQLWRPGRGADYVTRTLQHGLTGIK